MHQFLIPHILSQLSPELTNVVNRTSAAPCELEDKSALQVLISQLQLNPNTQLPATVSGACGAGTSVSVLQILTGTVVDDPDHGMDRDLPAEPGNSYDPKGDRKWMGGFSGPSSQGFRHMYFGGWKLTRPITTFQLPFHSVGQAPQRFAVLANKAKELIRANQILWGSRVLGWAMHYIQDLSQPFHAVQVLTWRMFPWIELFRLPFSSAIDEFIKENARIVTNFHWAYEGYTLYRVQEDHSSPFRDCLSKPEEYASLKFDLATQPIEELPHAIARASIQLAPDLGSSELRFFGPLLRQRGVDYTKNTKMIDFSEYSIRPDLDPARQELNQVTCTALANASLASRYLVQWAFNRP